MLQSERLTKSLLAESFTPRIATFTMGNVFERDLNLTNQPANSNSHGSDLCSSPKARRKRRVHSTGSSNCIALKSFHPTGGKDEVIDAQNSQSGCTETTLSRPNDKTVTFLPDKKTQQKTSEQTVLNNQEGIAQSANVVMVGGKELQNLKDLVLRHLDLVKEQQEVIAQKDQIIANLRMDNNMLKTRLDRMDRRLSKTPAGNNKLPKATSHDSKSPKNTSVEEPAQTTPTTTTATAINTTTAITKSNSTSLSSWKVNVKSKSSSKKRRLTRIPILPSADDGLLRVDDEYFSQQVHEYHELSERTIPTQEDVHLIEVPTFKLISYSSLNSVDESEDISDQAYLKRHQRHENEERRRKRWDLQRLREVKMIEKLKQNKSQISKPDSGSNVDSIFPKAENVEATEFSLPWYKPALTSTSKGSKKKRRTKR